MKYIFLSFLILAFFCSGKVAAQVSPNREFRGVWLATVGNLDWPVAGASAESQKTHLRQLLDKIKEANFNAVFFQIRTECDAFYLSDKEPWSRFLTGRQGVDPGYDPLAFAVEEAHKRGLELHAWFNPFRVNYSASAAIVYANNHISKTRPEWLLRFSTNKQILNPGIPEVREYITAVVSEVVEKYAVDGVHFDDYFYPYPEGSFNGISQEDAQTFAQYGNGFKNIKDWRRNNVNETIRLVNDRLKDIKPEIRFGISPFGIWKTGVPAGTTGMNAYNVIYADAVTWLEKGFVDYLTPQLYWGIGSTQNYRRLLEWWADKAQAAGRHLYAGQIVNQTGYTPIEVPDQIKINRENQDRNVRGSVLFRANDLRQNKNQIFSALASNTFKYPAAPPVMAWQRSPKPAAPVNVTVVHDAFTDVYLVTWQRGAGNKHPFKRYLVYSLTAAPGTVAAIPDGRVRAFTSAETVTIPATDLPGHPSYLAVTEISPNNQESNLSNVVALTNVVTGVAEEVENFPVTVYPNPTADGISIGFALEKPANVRVQLIDLDGQLITEMQRLKYGTGEHLIQVPRAGIPAGLYLLLVAIDNLVEVKKVVFE